MVLLNKRLLSSGTAVGVLADNDVFKQKTEKTDDIDKSVESVNGPVKAIVAHCEINDIRTKTLKLSARRW